MSKTQDKNKLLVITPSVHNQPDCLPQEDQSEPHHYGNVPMLQNQRRIDPVAAEDDLKGPRRDSRGAKKVHQQLNLEIPKHKYTKSLGNTNRHDNFYTRIRKCAKANNRKEPTPYLHQRQERANSSSRNLVEMDQLRKIIDASTCTDQQDPHHSHENEAPAKIQRETSLKNSAQNKRIKNLQKKSPLNKGKIKTLVPKNIQIGTEEFEPLELKSLDGGICEGKEETKISSVASKVHSNSLTTNPYLNFNSANTFNRDKSLDKVVSPGMNNSFINSRNLIVLNRNLRNIAFLKSSNPLHGSKSKDRVLDLQSLDLSSNKHIENPGGVCTQKIHKEINDNNASQIITDDRSLDMYNPSIDTSLSINSIINRRSKPLTKNVSPYEERLCQGLASISSRDTFKINPSFKVEFSRVESTGRAGPIYKTAKREMFSKDQVSNITLNTEEDPVFQNQDSRSIIFPPNKMPDMKWSSIDQSQNLSGTKQVESKNISRRFLYRKRSSQVSKGRSHKLRDLSVSYNISKTVLPGIVPTTKTSKDLSRGRMKHIRSNKSDNVVPQSSDHHVMALLDGTDIANSDILERDEKRNKSCSLHDGFVLDLNITHFHKKYKIEPPKLLKKPPAEFFELRDEFLKRSFMEMKDWIQQQVYDHLAKEVQRLVARGEIVDTDCGYSKKISLFTVNGSKIKSFNNISPDLKVIIISLDGAFRGLQNSLKPSDSQKLRIIQEDNMRNAYFQLQKAFAKNCAAEDKHLVESYKNAEQREKMLDKYKYSRGFRPPYRGGLLKPPTEKKSSKSKTLTFRLMYDRVSKNKSGVKQKKKAHELLKEYADKKSIRETTIDTMDDLEKRINGHIDVYINKIKSQTEQE
ncbi:unnamed protein product [Moneuplotes crassus]|uniref:Uncharacterized protein n=1 Tax=Euplotes crassus TaxID=5936 RepID=A0AAD1XD83_EUPCR|nr:unnamed protein product [Moneuplotes crassus]